MSAPARRTAPAKVNLALHVTGRRQDGYHLLESLVAFTGHGDLIEIEEAPEDEIIVSGHYAAQVPLGGDNLVARARDLLRDRAGDDARAPVRLHLEKNLPIASGIGGGSSDAAAALRLLVDHWALDMREEELLALGLRLGADVPMCLAARPLVARGIGEAIEALPHFPPLPMVLVNPNLPLITADVFSVLERRDNAPLPELEPLHDVETATNWLSFARNDLESPARQLVPQISDVLGELAEIGASTARMSGSGATCFGIFSSQSEAERAGAYLQETRPEWFVLPTHTHAAEASHGG